MQRSGRLQSLVRMLLRQMLIALAYIPAIVLEAVSSFIQLRRVLVNDLKCLFHVTLEAGDQLLYALLALSFADLILLRLLL